MELKPCPFCGIKAKIEYWYPGGDCCLRMSPKKKEIGPYWVRCSSKKCLVGPETIISDDKEQAIKAWNTRHTDSV